jgi:hypothetical protein
MGTVYSPHTTRDELVSRSEFARASRLARESLQSCQYAATAHRGNEYARNLAKRLGSGDVKLGEHIVTLLFDAIEREAPREHVERFPRTLLALIAEQFAKLESAYQLTLVDLVQRETRAKAAAGVAELEVALNPTTKTIADAAQLVDAELAAIEDLSAALHRRLAAA